MKIDSIGRAVSLQLAAGRLAVGTGAFFATRPALRALGFGETDAAGRALAKALGGARPRARRPHGRQPR